jgi:uncharacterized protein
MNQQDIIDRTANYVRNSLSGEHTGHDWWHTHRVRQTAILLAEEEHADRFVVELAALLHDVADWKFHGGDESAGPRAARTWLESLSVDRPTIDHVCDIVAGISFKGAGVPTPMQSLEGQIVQDADRLDALGAIGIARTFAYGGHKGKPLHDPEKRPALHDSFESYKQSPGTSINHFYEKLLLLHERMNTRSARRLARSRHEFMLQYLARFFLEWDPLDNGD